MIRALLIPGDCLAQLKRLPAESVDSLVTDPPAGISFMGKDWDSDKGGRSGWVAWLTDVMRECNRVMKPGAHGLVWAIPRTSHWTMTALEDAGFEVRDVVTHLFGQGFPKSLDVSKAIDKAAGLQRPRIAGGVGSCKTQSLGRFAPGEALSGEALSGEALSGEALSGEAKQWAGWGTALKPAAEFWILVRKPLSEKNVAANVLKWGTGAINIDGSRVESQGKDLERLQSEWDRDGSENSGEMGKRYSQASRVSGAKPVTGRFPANLVLSHTPHCSDESCDIECAIQALDGQAGFLHGPGNKQAGTKVTKKDSSVFGMGGVGAPAQIYDRGGGASRFFYCAKTSPSERGADNNHPTVKPQKLMQYLCRLITPPGGVVLDPFMGSGSTGVAAKHLGLHFVGVEREREYFEIAVRRVGGPNAND